MGTRTFEIELLHINIVLILEKQFFTVDFVNKNCGPTPQAFVGQFGKMSVLEQEL